MTQPSPHRAVGILLLACLMVPFAAGAQQHSASSGPAPVSFPSGSVTLGGTVYKPRGEGPFPAVVYNHGSAPGSLNDLAFEQLGPLFVQHGWVFFAPYRRGQGLSAAAGPYAVDEIAAATHTTLRKTLWPVVVGTIAVIFAILTVMRRQRAWIRRSGAAAVCLAGAGLSLSIAADARADAIMQVLERDQLADHLAAYDWLKRQSFVDANRIATAGNSFGGIITLLAAKQVRYCAAIDAAGGAENWSSAVADGMIEAGRQARAPVFLFQAANDYSLEPTQRLGEEMRRAGRAYEAKIYPAFGSSRSDGHSFGWQGSAVWSEDVFRFLKTHCG
jgi:carboxymethylenebutenolidase